MRLASACAVVLLSTAGLLRLPARNASPPPAREPADDTIPRSSDWLSLLPDGLEKQRFVLDCTGCHQLDAQVVRPGGKLRGEGDYATAITRMLGFAGATTGFPVIGHERDARATAAWMARHLATAPKVRPHPPMPAGATVTEYLMPEAGDLPHDVAVDDAGRVIVTGMFSHAMWVLDPATSRFERVDIPVANANPRAVEIDDAGNWWVVLGARHTIARYTPAAKRWRTWAGGFYPHSLAVARDGVVWFNGHFTASPELIAFVDTAAAAPFDVRTQQVPSHPALASVPGGPIPYELRIASDGRLWGTELAGNRVFRFDPASRAFDMYDMPAPAMGPRRLDIDARGIAWIPAYATNELVRLDPATRAFTRHPLPIPDAVPYVVRVDDAANRVWIGTSAADVVFSFDRTTNRFTAYPLPSRGAMVRHMAIDPKTHDLWLAYGASPGRIPARIARLRTSP